MAKVTATVFKAQVATAAAALTTALQDDTLTELANEYKPNHHALRRIEKLFNLDKATGVVTADDVYVDAVYAGNTPNKGTEMDGQGEPTPLTLVSATIEAAEPADIVLTFSEKVFENPATAISIGGAAGELKAIQSVTYAGTVVTVTMDSDFIAADVATVTGIFFNYRKVSVTLTDNAVVNNIV